MKIDELIKQRKDQLDVEHAPPEVWQGISAELKKPKTSHFQWWKVAAIIFICFSIGLFVQNRLLQNQVDELASLGDISEEYSVMENDYITQVNQLQSAIPINELKEQEDYKWIFEELKILEEINTMYRSDIGKVNKEQLVGVLIDYYEKKIKLLKKLELEIERNEKRNTNEKATTDHIRI